MMADEEKQRDVTRKELASELEKAQAINARLLERLDALEAKQAAPTVSVQESILQRELDAAHKELSEKRELLERARSRPSTPDVTWVPYKGLVKAMDICCIDHRREKGEVFHVDVPALWTDDPYIAVRLVREVMNDDGQVIDIVVEPNTDAPNPINFRFRKVVSAAEDPTPRRANEY